jgi:hypothetical protein
MNIDQLRLSPAAKKGALFIFGKHPYVIFTSGRRDVMEQAHAMACNVVVDPKWVYRTYLRGAPLQTAIDSYRLMARPWTVQAIEDVLLTAMHQLTDAELRGLSRHYTGDAFDIKPLLDNTGGPTPQGEAVLDTIQFMKRDPSFGVEKFLTKEGDLIRWHVQFIPSVEV